MRALLIRLLGGIVPDAPKTSGVPPPARVGPSDGDDRKVPPLPDLTHLLVPMRDDIW